MTVAADKSNATVEVEAQMAALAERVQAWALEQQAIGEAYLAVCARIAGHAGYDSHERMYEASFGEVAERFGVGVLDFMGDVDYLAEFIRKDGNGSGFDIDWVLEEAERIRTTVPNL